MPILDFLYEPNKTTQKASASNPTSLSQLMSATVKNPYTPPKKKKKPEDKPGSFVPLSNPPTPENPAGGHNSGGWWSSGYYNMDEVASYLNPGFDNTGHQSDIILTPETATSLIQNALPTQQAIEQSYTGSQNQSSGGGGGKKEAAQPLVWKQTYNDTHAPSWWRGMTPTQGMNPTAGYAAMMNALIPYMAPEDQRTYAQNLARLIPEAFGSYGDIEKMNFDLPTDVTPQMRQWYTGAERAQGIQDVLQRMVSTSPSKNTFNADTLGPGYTYFQNLGQVLEDFGGTQTAGGTGTSRNIGRNGQAGSVNVNIPAQVNPQTRQQYTQLRGALDPLLSETKQQSLSPFGPAAQSLAMPFFSAEDLVPVRKLSDGRWVFGQPQSSWY